MYDNRTLNNTNNISKIIHQHTTAVVNDSKLNNVSNITIRIIILLTELVLIHIMP